MTKELLRNNICGVAVRMATPEDAHLEAFDNTKLQAVNTCPTWGVIRYQMHKTYSANSRAMALEAGGAMHEVFAATRMFQLMHTQGLEDHGLYHGPKMFGADRFEQMMEMYRSSEDVTTRAKNFGLEALYTSGFYDDPSDSRRTMSNLEEAALVYVDRWNFQREPVWVRDISDPHSDVGIEIPFDLVITYSFNDGTEKSWRYTGKSDGVHRRSFEANAPLLLHENKTGSRIDDTWFSSFDMATQITGYCLAIQTWTGEPLDKARILGLQIPLPKAHEYKGLMSDIVSRHPYQIARWFEWFYYSANIYETHKDDPIGAPKFTHSCNRYFRACSMLPFCASDDEEQALALEEMVTDEWSPLVDKSGD